MAHARAAQGINPQEMFGIMVVGPRVKFYRLRGRQNIVREWGRPRIFDVVADANAVEKRLNDIHAAI